MKFCTFISLIFISLLFAIPVHAVSLTAYRIYLDTDQRSEKFFVRNTSNQAEVCEVDFNYQAYGSGGDAKDLTAEEYDELVSSALKSIRYSPRQFELQPRETQYIAFNFRPTLVKQGEEKRVYMLLKCEAPKKEEESTLLSPRLIQRVPIIIRNDRRNELFANITFENVEKRSNGVRFDLAITGSRSSFGDLIAENKVTGNKRILNRNIGLYPEMGYRSFSYGVKYDEFEDTVIRFEENTNYGGDQVIALSLREVN